MATNFFKDKHGNLVLGQGANPPIAIWFVLYVINYVVHSPAIAWLATAFLFTWAFMELYQGVNYFRRLLGLVVLAGIILAHLR